MKKFKDFGRRIFSVLMVIAVLQMFFQFNFVPVIKVYYAAYLGEDGKELFKDNADFVTFGGDTLKFPSKLGELQEVVGYDSLINYNHTFDSWMLRDTKTFHIVNGAIAETYHPDYHKMLVEIRQIDEHKTEKLALLPLAAATGKKSYFEVMRRIGQQVDVVIDSQQIPTFAQEIHSKRRGTNRLRSFMSYLAYSMAGGQNEKIAADLAAVSELTNLHLYCYNYLLDAKYLNIKDNRIVTLVASGQFFADMTTKVLTRSEMDADTKVKILDRLAIELDKTYQGQIADAELTIANCPDTVQPYLQLYADRCGLLSGPMYGFSLWLGYAAVGDYETAELAYQAGYTIGQTVQIMNDIADFSPAKTDYLADWCMEKMTLPLYNLMRFRPELVLTKDNISQAMVASGALQYSLSMAKAWAEQAKDNLGQLPDSPENDLLKQIMVIVKDNRHLRHLWHLNDA